MTQFLIPNLENPYLQCGDRAVCPGDTHNFACETRGSSSLSWMSDEYIGRGGAQLQLHEYLDEGTVKRSGNNSNVFTNLTINECTNGVRVLKSVLTIPTSPDIQNTRQLTITCINGGLATKDNCTVYMSGRYIILLCTLCKKSGAF